MASVRFQGTGVNVVWGTSSANLSPTDGGMLISASVTKAAERIPVLDDNGIPTGTVYVPNYVEGQYEILVQSNTNIPSIGDNITIDGNIVGVENVEKTFEQKGIAKLRVRGAALPV